jgi:hypothetical protein
MIQFAVLVDIPEPQDAVQPDQGLQDPHCPTTGRLPSDGSTEEKIEDRSND